MATKGLTVWFTGWSGAGKTTLSRQVYVRLQAAGVAAELLDGDAVRRALSPDLGYSKVDRDENVRRLGYVAGLLNGQGVVTIVAAISPYRAARQAVRAASEGRFMEVYVMCSPEVLIARDTKGLYRRALRGEIAGFTGINDPYEPPSGAEVVVDTAVESVEESTEKVWRALIAIGE